MRNFGLAISVEGFEEATDMRRRRYLSKSYGSYGPLKKEGVISVSQLAIINTILIL